MSDAYDALVHQLAPRFAGLVHNMDDGTDTVDRLLDAVLSVRPDVQCERCGGNGVDPDLTGGYEGTPSFRDVEACVNCHGAGTVPGELAIVQVLIERGVLLDTNRHGLGNDGEMLYRVVDLPDQEGPQ